MAHRLQYRRDTAARWKQFNPILQEGEVGYETDTHHQKVGDGVTAWNSLEYVIGFGNIANELGDSENLAISQQLVSEIVKYRIGNFGLSIYDEIWEIGDINSGNGNPVEGTTTLRTKNYIECFGGTKYNITNANGFVYYYDYNKNFISFAVLSTDEIITYSNACYFKIVLSSAYGTTYNDDIKIFQHRNWIPETNSLKQLVSEINKDVRQIENVTWEIGDINSGNGNPVEGTTTLRTKNYIECFGGTIDISLTTELFSSLGFIYYYGKDKTNSFISVSPISDYVFDELKSVYHFAVDIPKNACYFKIVLSSAYGTTYNDDIIIESKKNLGEDFAKVRSNVNSILNKLRHSIGVTWEIGDINSGNGNPVEGTTTLRTKNYIECSLFRSFNISVPVSNKVVAYIYSYSSIKEFISVSPISNGIVDIPKNACYFKIVLSSAYGTTYNDDIIIEAYYQNFNITIVSQDGLGDYKSLTDAVNNAVDGDIIFIKNGVYDNEAVKARYKNLYIVGESRYGVVIKGAGDYSNPPIEMSSGVLKDITVNAYGTSASQSGRYAYAIHADYDILANNSFIVENCNLITKMGAGAVGMGLRGNCHVLFKNCDFINDNGAAFFMNETVSSSNYKQQTGNQYFEFNGCKFICNNPNNEWTVGCEGYHSREGLVYATFINNVFVHADKVPVIMFYTAPENYWDELCENIEGNIVVDSNGTKMINWFITNSSFGNTIPALNRFVEGSLNNLPNV